MLQEEITINSIKDNLRENLVYADDDIAIVSDTVRSFLASKDTRLSMNYILTVQTGKISCTVNHQRMELKANQYVICPPNVGVSDIMSSPDFTYRALFFTNRILRSFLREKITVWDALMCSRKVKIFSMDEQYQALHDHFFAVLQICSQKGQDKPYTSEVVRALVRAAFIGLGHQLEIAGKTETPLPQGNMDKLFRDFMALLGGSEIKHNTVAYYAEKLCVSPKYLSSVCKRDSGKTANDWISERLQEEVRYSLEHTDLSIKQICYQLGFSTPSFFSKYVRANFGVTPLQLRRRSRQ